MESSCSEVAATFRRTMRFLVHVVTGEGATFFICTWNALRLLGSAASSQRARLNKPRYLKRIAERSDIVCLQETHGR